MSWYSLLYYVQTKVIEKGDELVKNELENSCWRNWPQLISLVETDPKKQFDFFFKCFEEYENLALEDYDFTPIVRRFDKCDDEIYKLSLVKIKETNDKINFYNLLLIYLDEFVCSLVNMI